MLSRGNPMAPVPSDFFGMHINKVASNQPAAAQTPWCELGQSWHRIWDNYTSWKLINTADGVFDWSRLDDVVAIAGATHGKKLLMNIACAPDWATGSSTGSSQYSPGVPTDAAQTAWVTALVTRYAGKIAAYELWNEPNDSLFWGGTVAQLVHLCSLAYPIIKALDPNAIVLAPCPTSILSVPLFGQLLDAGMASYCDAFAFHAYVAANQPEYAIYTIDNYKGIAKLKGFGSKSFWNTESGWLTYVNQAGTTVNTNTSSDVMTDQQGASYVARLLLVTAAAGLRASFYYTADGQADGSYLMKPTFLDYATRSTKQRAALSWQYVASVLAGGALGKIIGTGRYFQVAGVTAAGRYFTAHWCPDWVTASISAPSGATSATDNVGTSVSISGTIAITMEPTFFFY